MLFIILLVNLFYSLQLDNSLFCLKKPRFHASILWSLGESAIDISLRDMIRSEGYEPIIRDFVFVIERMVCGIGNKPFFVDLIWKQNKLCLHVGTIFFYCHCKKKKDYSELKLRQGWTSVCLLIPKIMWILIYLTFVSLQILYLKIFEPPEWEGSNETKHQPGRRRVQEA